MNQMNGILKGKGKAAAAFPFLLKVWKKENKLAIKHPLTYS
jgi:hypothetical protein